MSTHLVRASAHLVRASAHLVRARQRVRCLLGRHEPVLLITGLDFTGAEIVLGPLDGLGPISRSAKITSSKRVCRWCEKEMPTAPRVRDLFPLFRMSSTPIDFSRVTGFSVSPSKPRLRKVSISWLAPSEYTRRWWQPRLDRGIDFTTLVWRTWAVTVER